MKLVHKTLTTVAVSLTAALSLWGTPVLANTGDHHDHDHGQSSTQTPTNSSGGSTNPGASTPVVRKNVVDMTQQEIDDYVNAILTLKNTYVDGSTVSVYDQFVAIHVEAMGFMPLSSMSMGYYSDHSDHADHDHDHMSGAQGPAAGTDAAHGGAAFLPWHREYTRLFEEALQTVNPNIAIPYLDWTDPHAWDVVFSDNFLGGNGTGSITVPGMGTLQGGPVTSGPFTPDKWVLNKDIHVDFTGKSRGTVLERYMGVIPFDTTKSQADEVQVLGLDNYDNFRLALQGFDFVDNEGNLVPGLGNMMTHNAAHGMIGGGVFDLTTTPPTFTELGTMTFIASPYDPVFWLVHSNVDRLWAEWQDNGHAGSDYYPATGQPYGHNLNDRMWPWDAGQSTPANVGPGDLLSYLPNFSDYIVKPVDVMDYWNLGYTYDTSSAHHYQPDQSYSEPAWLESIAKQVEACRTH